VWNIVGPFGASINPSNGVLRWTPACSQGSTTNILTVWATDRARTSLSDLMVFTVVVKDCVAPQLGRLVLRTGDTGRLPIDLISSVPLTNLTTFITADTNRLVPVGVEPIAVEICNIALTPSLSHRMGEGSGTPGEGMYLAALGTCSNQFLVGTQQVAWLVITAVANQQSAFVPVEIGPSIGTQPDGTFVTNYVTQAGRVVIVGAEPLLEAGRSTNGLVQVILYAPVGTTNTVQTTTQLPVTGPWTPWQQITPTNLVTPLPPLSATNRTLFLRAARE
jgi:hypothetical protein